MQKFISISFVLLYFLAMFRPVQPVLYYYLNQDYIAEFLCINKDKPEMHCDGKCYLMKQLAKQEQHKGNPTPNIQLENYPIGFVYIFKLNKIQQKLDFAILIGNEYRNNYSYLFQTSSFHPPQL
ncbi:MAG TPA: hypothetical protein VFM82_00550 [Flavobacteriaceae bacterium]|nr:hypothetical protein [Flavobacteriaceae bacterium]